MVDAVKGTISGRAIRGDRQICGPNTPRLTKSRKPVDIMLCPALICVPSSSYRWLRGMDACSEGITMLRKSIRMICWAKGSRPKARMVTTAPTEVLGFLSGISLCKCWCPFQAANLCHPYLCCIAHSSLVVPSDPLVEASNASRSTSW